MIEPGPPLSILTFGSGSLAHAFLRVLVREGRRWSGRELIAELRDATLYGPVLYENAAAAFTLYASAECLELANRLGLALPDVGAMVERHTLPPGIALLYRARDS